LSGPSLYIEPNSLWAPDFVATFTPTATSIIRADVMGHLRDLAAPDRDYAGIVIDHRPPNIPDIARTDISLKFLLIYPCKRVRSRHIPADSVVFGVFQTNNVPM
jgi:hypothetical protein